MCNGLACKNAIPGPGAKGIGTGFIRNYQKWQELCVNMDTICENKPVDTSGELFGQKVALPVFAAPLGALTLHYGDKYDDLAYNEILVAACAENGIAAFTGDGTNPAVMEGAAQVLAKNGGQGVPTIKPWNMDTVKEKLDLVKAANPFAIAMDIDAAGLPFLKNMTPPAGSKTVDELKQIVEECGKEACAYQVELTRQQCEDYLKVWESDYGMQVHYTTEDEVAQFKALSDPIYEEAVSKYGFTQDLLDMFID